MNKEMFLTVAGLQVLIVILVIISWVKESQKWKKLENRVDNIEDDMNDFEQHLGI